MLVNAVLILVNAVLVLVNEVLVLVNVVLVLFVVPILTLIFCADTSSVVILMRARASTCVSRDRQSATGSVASNPAGNTTVSPTYSANGNPI